MMELHSWYQAKGSPEKPHCSVWKRWTYVGNISSLKLREQVVQVDALQ
jgi:hypothetical protein